MSLATHLGDFSHPASFSVRVMEAVRQLDRFLCSLPPFYFFAALHFFLVECLCDSCVLPVRGPLEACRGLTGLLSSSGGLS